MIWCKYILIRFDQIKDVLFSVSNPRHIIKTVQAYQLASDDRSLLLISRTPLIAVVGVWTKTTPEEIKAIKNNNLEYLLEHMR